MQHLTYPYGVLPSAVSEVTEKLSFDAFSKLRVSEAYGLFESKFITSKQAHVWEDLTDTSGVSTYLPDESSIKIEVGSGANDYCIRQTFKYWPYVAGNSQRILLTGNFQSKDTGRVKRIGLFDDDNGVYFELAEDDLYCVVRSKTSGTVVNTRVKRTAFNVDKLDGSGPSGIVMDYSKRQILLIQFQWLGVGSVGFGFSYLGKLWLCHVVHHANAGETVYMTTPNLPVRYEIRNTGTATGTGVMKQICCSVASEGGYQIPGLDFCSGNKSTGKAISSPTRTLVMAIRLKNTFNSKANRRIAQLKQFTAFALAANIFVELEHVSGVTATTATWSDIENDSGIEISTDISAFTAADIHPIDAIYLASGVGGTGGGKSTEFTGIDHNLSLAQNAASNQSQMFVVYATSLAGNGTVFASLSWTEYE